VASEICHRRRVSAVFVNNQHDIKRRGQDFDTKFVFERVHSEEVDRRISREKLDKAWCYSNKLFKMLRDTGTVNRWPGSGRPRIVPVLNKTLSFFFRSSRSLPLTLFCRLSGEVTENTFFVRKENKVSGILREILKQKLSALHASSAVRVCQLLCTAFLETFQMHVSLQKIWDTNDISRDISRIVLWVCGLSS